MKKRIVLILILVLVATGTFFASYLIAKKQAERVASSFPGRLSPLHSSLFLFGSPELTPCWSFRAEYADAITGATFDVYISLTGKVIKIPPKSKLPQ